MKIKLIATVVAIILLSTLPSRLLPEKNKTHSIPAQAAQDAPQATEQPKLDILPTQAPQPQETPQDEPVDIINANPQGCNMDIQWIWEDGSCHDKQTAQATNPQTLQLAIAQPTQGGDCSLVYNYSNWDARTAYAVCMAESGGNSNASNYNDHHGQCSGSFGLFQIACFWMPNPYDPSANVAMANEIWSRSGWQPWGAYTSGSYTRYL